MRIRIIELATALLLINSISWASSGGPQLARVLGWDPREHKVFFNRENEDESGEPGGVWYFDLKSKTPTRAVRARSLEGDSDDLAENPMGALKPLLRRLQPMNPVTRLAIDLHPDVLLQDSLPSSYCVHYRVRVEVRGISRSYGLSPFDPVSFECDTYGDTQVAVASVQEAEGFLLVVVAYRGVPQEECYEYQSPVLIRLKRW